MDVEQNFVAKHDRFLRLLKAKVEEARPEYARVVLEMEEQHRNGMGAAHGGLVYSLADLAFGAASNAGRTEGIVSLAVNIQYLLPGHKGPLVAEARAERLGGHILVYDVEVLDGDGQKIAIATFTGYATHIKLPQ